jgi:hypothetical protein
MNEPEINKLELSGLPPHVLKAVREENARFRAELHQFGPHVVPLDTLKPRLRAARDEAIKQQEQENR